MTAQHFRTLDQQKQNRKLLSKGICIADREHEDYQALLFQLDGFYAEVFFHRSGDEVLFIRCFDGTDELEPYLQAIDLSCVI